MPTASGFGEPPADVETLTSFPDADGTDELHRLTEWPGVWWYATADTADPVRGGRFDLIHPQGTCYMAESLDGALVEKLLRAPTKAVVAERLAELNHAVVTVRTGPPTADLTTPSATRFGLNAEVHTTLDYPRTRRWAEALWRAGWRGIRYLLRGDVAAVEAGRAIFGSAGLHARAPGGMTTRVHVLVQHDARNRLTARGVQVLPIPTHVPITHP